MALNAGVFFGPHPPWGKPGQYEGRAAIQGLVSRFAGDPPPDALTEPRTQSRLLHVAGATVDLDEDIYFLIAKDALSLSENLGRLKGQDFGMRAGLANGFSRGV